MASGARAMGSREVARRAVRAEISGKAMALFIAQGFEETTVEQIAAEVGMSARTLFRYFDSKEDMVVGDMRELGVLLADALDARPAEEGPHEALRRALDALLAAMEGDREGAVGVVRMFAETPALQVARQQKRNQWHALLLPGVVERVSGGDAAERALRADAIVASTLACLDAARRAWEESGHTGDMARYLDAALGAARSNDQ